MANINLKYYKNDDRYSDGDIEDVILKMAQENIKLSDMKNEDVSYPILYHLTKVRENILNWYPFKGDEKVLEIGAGCGAITGLLCQKVNQVVAVDLSKRRAQINYARHQEYSNLEIFVGNLNDMEFEQPFDYIIVNGVFEYAMSFTAGDTPYETFLAGMSRFLKEDGKIIIAIENRLGLKYFAGAPEDHTDVFFQGLNQYLGCDSVRTFSKTEIITILEKVGFKFSDFYYPYPDYKFPNEIFTDETFLENEYGKSYANYTKDRYNLFRENKMAETLVNEGVMSVFSNSFLIVTSRKEIKKQKKVTYVKINNDRDERFRILTSIVEVDGKKEVIKAPLDAAVMNHMRDIFQNSHERSDKKGSYLKGRMEGNAVIFPYIETPNLNKEVLEYIKQKNAKKIQAVIKEVYDLYLRENKLSNVYHTESFAKIFGNKKLDRTLPCMQEGNVDLICDNIYRINEGLEAIDCEWIIKNAVEVPVQFIIWRTINELYAKYPELEKVIRKREFYLSFEIDEVLEEVFWHWATYFSEEYVKSNSLAQYRKDEYLLNQNKVSKLMGQENEIHASLYYDDGNGYSEDKKIIKIIKQEQGKFSVTFDLSEKSNVKSVRFDPLEGSLCRCSLQQTGTKFVPVNAVSSQNNEDIFLTVDPMYEMKFEGKVYDEIQINGRINKIKESEIEQVLGIRPKGRRAKRKRA